jgi:hypothetical protein
MSATQKQLNSTFFLILFLTLNTLMLSYSGLDTSKQTVNHNIIEIKSEPGFFAEVKNCIESLSKGIFIHYDYSEEDEVDNDEDDEEEEEDIFEKSSEKYSIEQDLETLQELEQNLDKFKDGEIDEEELKLTKIKIDRIMHKYNKKNMNDNKIEKAEEALDDEEYIDEENQNTMVRAYVNEKLDETTSNDIVNEQFDEILIESIKKLNILKLFTMEAKVNVNVAAVL